MAPLWARHRLLPLPACFDTRWRLLCCAPDHLNVMNCAPACHSYAGALRGALRGTTINAPA